MDRVAILVDAGYFFAAGSALVSGAGKQSRATIVLHEALVAEALKSFAHVMTGGLSLLRIYWYDGALRRTGPSAVHMRLAATNDIKVRLGFLNAAGEQKGVDSLIVTDLVELARNRAVTDVVLMSGDEDVRVGVQLAQGFGVRVHLLGIKPCAETQSVQLRDEADTCSEWDVSVVEKILSLRPETSSPLTSGPPASLVNAVPEAEMLSAIVEHVLGELALDEAHRAANFIRSNRNNVPRGLDGKLLARCRTALGRDLDDTSRRYVRALARQRILQMATLAA